MDRNAPPAKSPRSQGRTLAIIAAVLLALWAVGHFVDQHQKRDKETAAASTSTSTATSAAAKGCSSGPTCDATPKADGVYKVDGGGLFDTGITPGWIATQGPRDGSTLCSWARLSGPGMRLEWVIDGGNVKPGGEPAYVHVVESDNSFFSTGCQPWVRIDHKG